MSHQDSSLVVTLKHLLAGTIAGVAQVVVGYPLDTIKTRIQSEGSSGSRFNGPIDCLRQTLKHEGWRALFKGMSSPIAGAAFINAILFAAYGQTKHQLNLYRGRKPDEIMPLSEIALAGAVAGFVNCIAAGPVELVKTQMQVQYNAVGQKAKYSSSWDCAKKLYQSRGIRALSRGMTATIYREIPAYAAFYGVFEFSKRSFTPEGKRPDQLGAGWLMLAGSLAGIGYWSACYPIDVIKTKLQSEPEGVPSQYRGVLDAGRKILAAEGVRGLFKGFSTCIARTIPAGAATFTAYELTMAVLNSSK